MATFDRLQIGLNGSTEPNNFTIEIYSWDITGVTSSLRTTVATGVTRTTISTFNGGTLSGSTYGISGITGSDYYLKLTANNTCHTSATYSLREPALALSVYAQPPLSSVYSLGSPDSSVFTGSPGNEKTNSVLHPEIAYFDGLFYMADDAPAYPAVGAGLTFTSNFTIEHLGTYDANTNNLITGKWGNGLLQNFTITQQQSTPYSRYSLNGYQIPNIAIDSVYTVYKSQLRVTFNPSNTSRTFYYYWVGTNV